MVCLNFAFEALRLNAFVRMRAPCRLMSSALDLMDVLPHIGDRSIMGVMSKKKLVSVLLERRGSSDSIGHHDTLRVMTLMLSRRGSRDFTPVYSTV